MKIILTLTLVLAATLAVAAVPPYGTWEWFETEESAGVFTTPMDAGYTVQYDFRQDMTYTKYQDEIVAHEGTFWVQDVEFMGQTISALNMDSGGISPDVCAYGIDDFGLLQMYWGADPQGFPFYPIERYASREPVATENLSWGGIKSLFR